MRLTITSLGSLQVYLDAAPLTQFRFERVRALLVYLAVECHTPHSRPELAHLLWPDEPTDKAAQNLRQALSTLRGALNDANQPDPFLLVTAKSIQFNPHSDYSLDLARFRQSVKAVHHHAHRRLAACTGCLQRLREVVELYRGDFLSHFSIDSELFEEWVQRYREPLHIEMMQALSELTDYYLRHNQPIQAVKLAQRQLALDPFCDVGHHQLIQSLAADGKRNTALVHYHNYRKLLAKELGVTPSVKTVEFCNRLARDEWQEAIGPFQPPHNLPAELAPLVGYKSELAYLTERLASNECRLLTIAGPGGCGKTRLALRAAWQEIPNFQGGVYFVNLSAIKPEQLLSAINAVLFLTLEGKAEPKAELYRLLTWLRQKELLLILDGFEHMKNQTDLLLRLLHMSPGLTILVTSREWTQVSSETVLILRGLKCPPAEAVDDVEQYSAARYFLQCAGRLEPAFCLETAESRQALNRLCRLVGGMPLALQLAARWTPVFSLPEITAKVADNLAFLNSPDVHAPQYQRSLLTVFDSSWQRLSPQEQAAITRLAVFQGGFTQEAAQVVVQVSPAMLLALQSKSLVRPVLPDGALPVEPTAQQRPADARRYELPEPFRRYGVEQLKEQSRLAVRIQETNHGRYYLNFLHSQVEKVTKPPQRARALAAIRAELDNIRQAWKWLLSQQMYDRIAQTQYELVAFFTSEGQDQEAAQVINLAVEKLASARKAESLPFTTEAAKMH